MLKRNVGGLDRCARLAAGMVLVPVGLWFLGGIRGQLSGLVVATLGLVALATGLSASVRCTCLWAWQRPME